MDPNFKTKMAEWDQKHLASPEGARARAELLAKATKHGVALAFVANMRAAGYDGSHREGCGKEYRTIILGLPS